MDRQAGRRRPELKEPIDENDIRRFVQGMNNPNRLYFDEEFAADSAFGRHRRAAVVRGRDRHRPRRDGGDPGHIPGSHMLFGGDEWWFYGPADLPGRPVSRTGWPSTTASPNTRFAGPTMFQRGDTTYINQRGEDVAKQRSTAIRYLVENSREARRFAESDQEPEWTDEELEQFVKEQLDYYKTFLDHV